MAETTLTPTKINHGTRTGGATPTFAGVEITTLTAANTDGSCWVDDGKTFIIATASGATCVITVDKPKANDEGVTEDLVVSISTGKTFIIGPFGADFVSDTDGKVHATWTNAANLTLKVFSLQDKGRG